MPRPKHSELAVGTFVLLAVAAGVAVLVWLAAVNLFGTKGQVAYFAASVASGNLGLTTGSAVMVGSSWVGQVSEIILDAPGRRTLFKAQLARKDVILRSGAKAGAVAEFIGGAAIVVEDWGASDAPEADAEHPIALSPPSNAILKQAGYGDRERTKMQQAVDDIAAAVADIRSITSALEKETATRNAGSLLVQVKSVAANLQTATADLAGMVKNLLAETETRPGSLLAKVHASADDLNKSTGAIAGTVGKVAPQVEQTVSLLEGYTRKDIAELLANMRTATTDLVRTMAAFEMASGTVKDVVVANAPGLDDMIANLKSTSENLNAAAKEIRRNPWRLLQQPGEKDVRTQNLYDAVRAFSEGASHVEDALSKLKALREASTVNSAEPAQPGTVPSGQAELERASQEKYLEESFKKLQSVEEALWRELSK